MAIKKSSHSAPEKGKNGNSLTAVLEQATFPAESLTARRRRRQVCHQSLKERKSQWSDGTDAENAKFLILLLFDTQNHRE